MLAKVLCRKTAEAASRGGGNRERVLPPWGFPRAATSYLRKLLVQCAHHVLGHSGRDSALRRWGLAKGQSGGQPAVKRAIVAVARKLAVLLHRLWVTGETFQPFPLKG